MPLLLTILLVAITIATANTVGFEMRAHNLDQSWQTAQAAGVPAAELATARSRVSAQRSRRVGILPYPAVSGAAISDPFQQPEATADAAYRAAVDGARRRAEAALVVLRTADGPAGSAAYQARLRQLAGARRPIDLDALARSWSREAVAQLSVRQRLTTLSGGLTDGLPNDVVRAVADLSTLAGRAGQAGISTQGAGEAVAMAQLYLMGGYPALLAGHEAVIADLRAAAGDLQHRLDLRSRAADLMAKLPDLLQQAEQYGAGDDFKGRVDQIRADVAGARATGDDDRLNLALADLEKLTDDLQAANAGRLPAAHLSCVPGSPDQLIVIHLATQQLVAYDNGCPFLRTPITTGRPALPTGRGTFRIFYKAPVYHMVSPWPQGNPFYYPPTWVNDAMEFIADGTFLHSASWQPDSTYGPGSQYGPYASHGCIHVLDGPLQQLYDWAKIGATVVVQD
ncbi:MAG TPA: L,D-transpeptidase [Candidatus Dormibacteraeota bacterium]|nr:L,D-transpeptidase [Candidatus Dormibacteraeota bacterium]